MLKKKKIYFRPKFPSENKVKTQVRIYISYCIPIFIITNKNGINKTKMLWSSYIQAFLQSNVSGYKNLFTKKAIKVKMIKSTKTKTMVTTHENTSTVQVSYLTEACRSFSTAV